MNKKERELKKQAELRLEEAKKRGFKSKVSFTSTSGLTRCYVKGSLVVKWVNPINYKERELDPEYLEDAIHNGDIVSTEGLGCIYCAKNDKWAKINN